MPIEIRELVIKTSVSNKNIESGAGTEGSGYSEELINEVVDRVFAILQQKSER